MTKLELLREYHAQECNNLFISSDNYAMTRPRRGREKDYDKYAERVELLEEMIRIETAEDDHTQQNTSNKMHVVIGSIVLKPEQARELKGKLRPAIKAAYAAGLMM